jgi:dTDP-4-amino-4,6-dideoxygalactose transaminase
MSVPDTVRHGSAQVIYEAYPELGYNYRMTDVQAAIGRVQLQRLPEIVAARREIARGYALRLQGIAGVLVPHEPDWARSNWQSYCIRLVGADQRKVMQALLDRGISTRRGIMNAHLEGAYLNRDCSVPGSSLERSEAAQCNSIILPLSVQMSDAELDYVAETLGDVLGRRAAA